ncbi:MAG TPA: rhodanese-like domain-containing protein [Vicinamibacterales bacterium]|nr:rhodanese-like domain-containing protein [Vicinamibacterales bacterium]
MFQRFYDEGLAQASYLIGCGRAREAVVIDPRRDAAIYLDAARQAGVTITHAIETHIHADFISGARELAGHGIRVVAGPGSDLLYPHHEAADRERLHVGDLSLEFLHTPGHTPEHISILAAQDGEPTRLFTGDLLFVGGVGRPDLLGAEQSRQLANQLYESLYDRVLALDDDIEVHPGHGAGSLCGAGIGSDPHSTIGRERRVNPMLRHPSRETFVAAVLADLPDTPPYFKRMKRINREGPPVLGLASSTFTVHALPPAAAAALVADGALVIDLRPASAFAKAHPSGAVNLGFGSKVGYWAGWVVPPDVPLILLADDPAHVPAAAVQLLRVGLDRIEGAIAGGFSAWSGAGLPVSSIEQVEAGDLASSTPDALQIIDVRTAREWRSGHIDGSINIPVGELPDRLDEVPREGRLAVICEGGYRSALGASLLAREGFMDILNVTGGMAAHRALQPK